MAVTGAIFNSLVFGGVNSADYGIYITGEAVFNAPKRAVETVSVPGRNGDIIIDQGHWENIEVTYPAGTFGMSETEFRTALSDFRNAIISQLGYQRLSDTYHPDEYRMGTYVEGLEVDTKSHNKAGQFNLVFNCKPQRWLTEGETAITLGEWGETTTASGESVVINSEDGDTGIKAMTVSLTPTQEGSGTPSPSNPRPITGHQSVNVYVSPTTSAEDGQTYLIPFSRTCFRGTVDVVNGTVERTMSSINMGLMNWQLVSTETNRRWFQSTTIADEIKKPSASVAADALCSCYPIRNYNYAAGQVSPNMMAVGTNGKINVWASLDYESASDFKRAMLNQRLCYALETPVTESVLENPRITLQPGTNNVWSDGPISVEYGDDPNRIINPTRYTSGPLLAAEGYGNITVNGTTIAVSDAVMGRTPLSEAMRIYTTTSKLEKVIRFQNSLYNAGDQITQNQLSFRVSVNAGTYASGISSVDVSFDENPSGATAVVAKSSDRLWYVIISVPAKTYDSSAAWSATVSGKITYVAGGAVFDDNFYFSQYYYTPNRYAISTGSLFKTEGYPYAKWESVFIGSSSVYSTISIAGHPLYIDCENGEAYKIEDDEVISLNDSIFFGTELPKLVPGLNEITFSSTITELKVTPRWWKL